MTFVAGSGLRPTLSSLADIEAVERVDYETAVPVRTPYELLCRAAALFADRPAITMLRDPADERSGVVLSYAGLLNRVNQTANVFRSLGLGSEESVALLLPTLPETLIALWGAMCAGRACPINYMLSPEQIAAILREVRARILVILGPDDTLPIWPKLNRIRELAPELSRVLVVRGNEALPPKLAELDFDDEVKAASTELAFLPATSRDDIAAFFHTGGSTGAPKLVTHTHGNQVHASWFFGCYFDMSSDDVVINGFPLFHVAGAICYGGGCIAAGAHIVIPSRLGMRDRAFVANYWRIVDAFGVTLLNAGPTFLMTILGMPAPPARPPAVRAIISGGSTLPPELAETAETRLGVPVRSVYGMTETCGVLTVEPLQAPRSRQSVGWPLPFSRLRLLDANEPTAARLAAPAAAATGLVAACGPQISPGYTDARHNAALFTSDGWLITGDLGTRTADGRLLLGGRKKDVIIRGGHNIDPVGIEDAILRHPDVAMCAAVGQPDPYAGELPVAFIVLRANATAAPADILAATQPDIPEPAAVPKRLYALPNMPMTATGKILRPSLRRLAAERIIREELEASWPELRAAVSCIDDTFQDRVVITLEGPAPEATIAALRDRLARYRLPLEIKEAEALPPSGR